MLWGLVLMINQNQPPRGPSLKQHLAFIECPFSQILQHHSSDEFFLECLCLKVRQGNHFGKGDGSVRGGHAIKEGSVRGGVAFGLAMKEGSVHRGKRDHAGGMHHNDGSHHNGSEHADMDVSVRRGKLTTIGTRGGRRLVWQQGR